MITSMTVVGEPDYQAHPQHDGVVRVVGPLPFAFDSPGLGDFAGFALFTPSVGDIILDLFVEVPVAFDCDQPFLDLGAYQSSEGDWNQGGPFLLWQGLNLGANAETDSVVYARHVSAPPEERTATGSATDFVGGTVHGMIPVRVLEATPICAHIVDLTNSTKGRASVYVVLASPQAADN